MNPSAEAVDTCEVDPTLFRRVLGRFTTGVTVVTALAGTEVRGMTANAFMSGSLTPPLVVVSIGNRTKLHEFLMRGDGMGISILTDEQADFSRHFAGRAIKGVIPTFDFYRTVPVLSDALATVATQICSSYECGDHTLFVGLVHHVTCREGLPLLYFKGAYNNAVTERHGRQAGGAHWDLESGW
jgi:flavin reductase